MTRSGTMPTERTAAAYYEAVRVGFESPHAPRMMRLLLQRASATAPWLVGGLVFVFRLSALRDLPNDHYMHLAWAQQVLFGLLPGLDFVEPGMPLALGASAIVQAIAPGPFWEAALSATLFGVTAALTVWGVARLTGSHIAGIMAAIHQQGLCIHSPPRKGGCRWITQSSL